MLLGYLVVDIFVNKMLNSHVNLWDCMRNLLCDKLFDWAFGDDEDDLNEALLQASYEFVSWLNLELCLQQVPPTTNQKLLHRNYCGSTEIRAMLLNNQIAVFWKGQEDS